MFHWRTDRDGLIRGFTSRSGGVSVGPYAGLNLGGHVADDRAAVTENRARVAAAVGLDRGDLVFMDQVHGATVAVVDEASTTPPVADALVTTRADLALVVLVADCVPVLLSSADGTVVAAVHAGRAGMVKGVVAQAISTMRELGAQDITGVVGPSVCSRCYEVPEVMSQAVADVEPVTAAVSWTGTPAIDVAAGVVAQLRRAQVEVHWLPGCTREEPTLYSHRRDGQTGRFAGIVRAAQ